MIVELANDIKKRNEVGKNFPEKNEDSIKFYIVEYKYNTIRLEQFKCI